MHLIAYPAAKLARSASRLSLMTLALVFALSLRGDDSPATPPVFADVSHVLNGCYLSTTAYLARFGAEFPGERGAPVSIAPRGFGGKHTIALVTWRGEWWGRDEYFGVFALGRTVARNPAPAALASWAEHLLIKHSLREVKAGRVEYAPATPRALTTRELATLVRRAAAALPMANEVFWVHGGGEPVPFLFFRPTADVIAVYDPLHGTATAETKLNDAATIVGIIAAKLGYRVAAVRNDAAITPGAVVAAR